MLDNEKNKGWRNSTLISLCKLKETEMKLPKKSTRRWRQRNSILTVIKLQLTILAKHSELREQSTETYVQSGLGTKLIIMLPLKRIEPLALKALSTLLLKEHHHCPFQRLEVDPGLHNYHQIPHK